MPAQKTTAPETALGREPRLPGDWERSQPAGAPGLPAGSPFSRGAGGCAASSREPRGGEPGLSTQAPSEVRRELPGPRVGPRSTSGETLSSTLGVCDFSFNLVSLLHPSSQVCPGYRPCILSKDPQRSVPCGTKDSPQTSGSKGADRPGQVPALSPNSTVARLPSPCRRGRWRS